MNCRLPAAADDADDTDGAGAASLAGVGRRVETATSRATTGSYAPRAMERAKTGGPMAILADDGVYLVEGDFTANRNAKLLDFVAKKIIAKGTVSERDLLQGRVRFADGPSFYVQLLGTHAHATWLWGWANEAPLPAHVLRVAGTLRSWGERQGVFEMTSATVFDEVADPEALALVSCALTPCAGLHPCHAGGGTIWLLVYGELDEPPISQTLTAYDREHMVLYLRLLDSSRDGADWREAVQILFGLDPRCEPERCRQIHDAHLARALWMNEHGYRELIRSAQ